MTKTIGEITSLPQPFGYYRVLTGEDFLHFGYWPDGSPDLPLEEAQELHLQLMLEHLPPAPSRVLDVGCGTGVTAGRLQKLGYDVIAIAPSEELIAYANRLYPGPKYIACPFEEDNRVLENSAPYDAILLQESLQYLPDLAGVFSKLERLLSKQGLLLICDEVSYDQETGQNSAVHLACDIETAFAEQGFVVRSFLDMGRQVTPTTQIAVERFEAKKQELLLRFGASSLVEIEQFTEGWRQQGEWYKSGQFGYCLWVLSPAEGRIRKYTNGDENIILEVFFRVFHQTRTLGHWQWKFKTNPFGNRCISTAWSGKNLVAHYAGYPVPVWLGDNKALVHHVGDTFTAPGFRGVGRGHSSILARTADHFFAGFCKGKVSFCYGFNTDRIQKLGRLFLGYQPVRPVLEWKMSELALAKSYKPSIQDFLLGHIKVEVSGNAGDWADQLFLRARSQYHWLIQRDREYLSWRYQQHPDFDYQFFVASRKGMVVGWCVGRMEKEDFLLIDALFDGPQPRAFQVILKSILNWSQRKGESLQRIKSWFSENPRWFTEQLKAAGFESKPQYQALDLCVKSFSSSITEREIGEKFYFTMGDSDLF